MEGRWQQLLLGSFSISVQLSVLRFGAELPEESEPELQVCPGYRRLKPAQLSAPASVCWALDGGGHVPSDITETRSRRLSLSHHVVLLWREADAERRQQEDGGESPEPTWLWCFTGFNLQQLRLCPLTPDLCWGEHRQREDDVSGLFPQYEQHPGEVQAPVCQDSELEEADPCITLSFPVCARSWQNQCPNGGTSVDTIFW